MTLDDARLLAAALNRYVKTERLDMAADDASRLRGWTVGEPSDDPNGVSIPPWSVASASAESVELTWTFELGHETGARRWYVAKADRTAGGWTVRSITLAHAHRARP